MLHRNASKPLELDHLPLKVSYKKTHGADKSGKSFGTATDFEFENGDSIRVICIDWDDEISKKK